MQVERHHFMLAFRCAKITCFFDFFDFLFDFSIPNLMASNPSTSAQYYDILTPVVAYHGPSRPPMLVYTSDFHVVASTSLSLKSGPTEKRCLASYGNYAGACRYSYMRWIGGNERSD